MAIEFECECGRKLSVPEDAAGRKAKCPNCGAVTDVPGTSGSEDEAEGEGLSKVDRVMDRLGEDFAESKERAPQLTKIAAGLAILSAATFVLTFFIHITTLVFWVLVWLPMTVVGGLTAVGMIRADYRTPRFVDIAAPLAAGAGWAILWSSAMPRDGKSTAPFTALIALLNAGVFVFLTWYFSRHDTRLLFPEPEQAVPAQVTEDEAQPAEEAEKQ